MTTDFDSFPDPFNAPGANERFATANLQATKLLLDQINVSAGNVTKTLQLGFGSAAASGRNFNDVLSTIAQSLTRMALRTGTKALAEGLVSGLSGMFSGAFGGAGTIAPFAQGGVVASPTYFASGGAMGLMGERGAEAIMPLARGADGRLGVVAQAAGARPVSVTVNIAAQDIESFRRSEAQITGALARAVARGQRNL
ncbi:MAG: Phage-related minor tail protein or protein transfer agent orfg11 like protein [Methylocystaceae bacterium]|nr:MAG: Phage-related minor tail protein or protein transfer agent orfg11 like protein [Methylocystaceae bacterium]KAF0211920.1 MAG: Phage-related minor tail protein or protein transfer agent orfg11 like [Methylocystaceae bacterium]TXT42591.1 MAG: Phage-related minor tail protein or protein transfer agent orfg11 like protein [Methylocystaceae bacterium]